MIVPPPPPRKKTRLPPPPSIAPNNIPGSRKNVDLNFKVPAAVHRRFAIEAALRGLSQRDLLLQCFDAYLRQYGGTFQQPASDLMQALADDPLDLQDLQRKR